MVVEGLVREFERLPERRERRPVVEAVRPRPLLLGRGERRGLAPELRELRPLVVFGERVANATCAPANATCAAVGCCRNQLLLTPANCVGVEVRASDWMDVFAADNSSGGAIALVAVGAVGAVAMALLARTVGEEMLAWDKISSARRWSFMSRTSRSLGSLPRAGRSQELPRWEVDPSGVCVCRSSNS